MCLRHIHVHSGLPVVGGIILYLHELVGEPELASLTVAVATVDLTRDSRTELSFFHPC